MKKKFIIPLALGLFTLGLNACINPNTSTPTVTPTESQKETPTVTPTETPVESTTPEVSTPEVSTPVESTTPEDTTPSIHTHEFSSEVAEENYLKDPATCTTAATYYKSCACGELGTETFTSGNPLGHTEVDLDAVAPTCTETGLTAGKHCTTCNTDTVAQEVVPASGHTEVDLDAVAPTCTETGLTAGKHCTACNTDTVSQEVVPANGHTEVDLDAVAPTCTETGLTAGKHCTTCNTDTVAQEVVPANGHTIKDGECTNCDYTEVYSCVVAAGNNGTTTIQDNKETAAYGETINALFAPAEGYVVVSYSVTTDGTTVKVPAFGRTAATIEVKGNTVISVEYDLASKYVDTTLAPTGSAAVIWYYADTNSWASGNDGDVARTYEWVIGKLKDSEGNAFNSEMFTLSVDPIANGKFLNSCATTSTFAGKKLYNIYGAKGDQATVTLTAQHKIVSVVITYASATHYTRAAVQSGDVTLSGNLIYTNAYSYAVEGNSFSITNISGTAYLYIESIEIVYEAPSSHEYKYDNDGHWIDCPSCDLGATKTAHTLENGVCVCGYSELCSVSVGTVENGTVSLSSASVIGGNSVTATFTPAEGYVLVSYSLTTEEGTKKVSAYGKTSVEVEITADTVVTAEYALADSVKSFELASANTGKVYLYNVDGTWKTGSATNELSETTYEYVVSAFKDAEGNSIDSSVFTVSGTPKSNGQWVLLQGDASSSYGGNQICLYGASGAPTDIKFVSEGKVYSVTLTYANSDHYGRAQVYAGSSVVEGTVEATTEEGFVVVSYVIDGNEFTVENKGNTYLYFNSLDIVYEAVASTPAIVYDTNTTIDLTLCPEGYQGNAGTWEGINIDATNGKFVSNGSGWMQFNTGTVLTFNVAENAKVTAVTYSEGTASIVVENGVATITAIANDYIKTITVAYPVVFDTNTTIDLTQCTTKYEGSKGSWEGIEIDATNGKFATNNGGWIQFNTGTVLTFNVAEGATVTAVTYSEGSVSIVVENGVATITATSNDYIKTITIAY